METPVRNRIPSHRELLKMIRRRHLKINKLSKESEGVLKELERAESSEEYERLSEKLDKLYCKVIELWDEILELMEKFRSKPFRKKGTQ